MRWRPIARLIRRVHRVGGGGLAPPTPVYKWLSGSDGSTTSGVWSNSGDHPDRVWQLNAVNRLGNNVGTALVAYLAGKTTVTIAADADAVGTYLTGTIIGVVNNTTWVEVSLSNSSEGENPIGNDLPMTLVAV